MAVGELNDEGKRRVNEAVVKAERLTGLEFCVVIAQRAGTDPRVEAERAFHKANMHERPSVFIVVTPSGRTLEIVVATDVAGRISDSVCAEAVQLMTGLFATDDIVVGLERGIALLAEHAGGPDRKDVDHVIHDLPNVLEVDED